jgi:hypothetical protein
LGWLVVLANVAGISTLSETPPSLASGHVYFQADFEATNALAAWTGPGKLGTGFRSEHALVLEREPGARESAELARVTLPVGSMRGYLVRGSAMVRAAQVGAKPNPWNGVKFMLAIETPGGPLWPQAAVATGTFDWRRVAFTARIPVDATAVTLVLGLEHVTGKVWFDDVKITVAKPPVIDIFEAHGWDWSYHAFREWNGWSVEHGEDRENAAPFTTPTQRLRLLQAWFEKDQKPRW